MKRRQLCILADLLMVALLPLLMAYSLIGETFHEVAGVLMLALFLSHHALHAAWLPSLFRGAWGPRRICGTAADLLLCGVMVILPLSGMAVSRHLFAFLPTAGLAAPVRTLHLLAAYWGYLLMSFHLGLHLTGAARKLPGAARWLWGAAALYGVWAFWRRDFLQYLFLRSQFVFFDFSQARVRFLADYLAVMVLFAALGCLAGLGLVRWERRRARRQGRPPQEGTHGS